MYILLILATLMFASQFLFNQKYQELKGTGLNASLTFSAFTNLLIFVIMFVLNKFKLEFTLFALLMAFFRGLVGIGFIYFSILAFAKTNLSVYSIFSMLGGMMLPFVYGVGFLGENLTVTMIASCVLIFISLILTFEKGNQSKTAIFYYIAIFVLNGMSGVLASIHQANISESIDSYSFMTLSGLCAFVICVVIKLFMKEKIFDVKKPEIPHITGYAFCCGIANLFTLIALTKLPASVQYPIITGGVMVFSTVISVIRKEKLKPKNYISTAIAFVSTLIIAL